VLTVAVDGQGVVDLDEMEDRVAAPQVGLVHCQLANHEVGTIQPVAEAAAICRPRGVLLHVDAAAGCGHVPILFDQWGVDLMSVTAHKMGGPRGIGALLVRRGLRIEPLMIGGDQERARRAGVENVGAAVGFGAVAAELAPPGALEGEARRMVRLTDRLRELAGGIEDVAVYGPKAPDRRLAHVVCLGIGGVEAEPVLIGLDQLGVAAHSGSSCASESLEPSPVLEAMGVDAERSLRLSVGWSTTDEDIDMAVEALPAVIRRLRSLRAG
jgi:cysteine desulfurase